MVRSKPLIVGEESVTVVTDADGVATVNASTLAEDDESLEELEVEYESEYAEGELEYVVENGSLTLVEEEYEYEIEDEEAEDEEEEESEETEDDGDD
jgi:hypothetical protein